MKTEISITWSIDDVKCQRPDLTDEQCSDVLIEIEKNHDATIGINWDVIDCTASYLFGDSK